VAERGLQGWSDDPFGLHEARYFSAGKPTKLVRDGGKESYDEPPSGTAGTLSADLTAMQIADEAMANLRAATSVRISGNLSSDGQTGWIDMTIAGDGSTGSFSIDGRGSGEFIRVGPQVWIRLDDQFLRSSSGGTGPRAEIVAKLAAGKYIKRPGAGAGLPYYGSVDDLADALCRDDGPMTKGKTVTINGQWAIELIDQRHGTIGYVSDSERPKLIRLLGANQQIDLTEYNAVTAIDPPPASLIFDPGTP
jgi:hypothetical protein